MPTTCWAKQIFLWRMALLGLLAGCAAMPACALSVASLAGPSAAASTVADKVAVLERRTPVLHLRHKAGKARLEIRFFHERVRILPLKTDASVNPKNASATVEIVARVSNTTLLIQDTYSSRPGALSMCQAGQETFLRVIALAPLKEMLSLKLASCRENIELASPGLEWQADSRALKIRWLSGPDHTAQEKILTIGSDGSAILSPP